MRTAAVVSLLSLILAGCTPRNPVPEPVHRTDRPLVAGYWHNWNSPRVPYFPLRELPPEVNRVIVSFAVPLTQTGGEMVFRPAVEEPEVLKQDIRNLQRRGVEVLVSIGGGNHPIELGTPAARDAFVESMDALLDEFRFDGMDIDLEGVSTVLEPGDTDFRNPVTPKIRHFIEAMQALLRRRGDDFVLSTAPETQYVTAAYHKYGEAFGGYLPILHALRDDLDVVHMQLYNSGSQFVYHGEDIPETVAEQGTVEFTVGLTTMLIEGFPIARDPGNVFPGLGVEKVGLGLPASQNAATSGGHLPPAKLREAVRQLQTAYPAFRGGMTWSLNWDRSRDGGSSEFEFVKTLSELLEPHPAE
jgi:chitinase